MGAEPVQVPGEAASHQPAVAVPLTVGGVDEAGGAPVAGAVVTAAVLAERASAEPAGFVAVTTT
jgi:hypothetical protein